MGAVLAVANQKGGVAKTTTVHALADAWTADGLRVLAVDLDPQACLTWSCGLDPDQLHPSMHDVLMGRRDVTEVARRVGLGFDLAPATIDLAGAEVHLAGRPGRERAVGEVLETVRNAYDLVVLDCPPSLGILTVNGLAAADAVVVPMQCEALSHRGVGQLLETVADVRAFANPRLEVLGVVATMFEGRRRLSRQIAAEVGERYGLELLAQPIARSVRFAEAPAKGRSIVTHAPGSAGAEGYRELARSIAATLEPVRA